MGAAGIAVSVLDGGYNTSGWGEQGVPALMTRAAREMWAWFRHAHLGMGMAVEYLGSLHACLLDIASTGWKS